MNCAKCNKRITEDEYVINWGWCNDCFADDYTEYMESVAGPFDWVKERVADDD